MNPTDFESADIYFPSLAAFTTRARVRKGEGANLKCVFLKAEGMSQPRSHSPCLPQLKKESATDKIKEMSSLR